MWIVVVDHLPAINLGRRRGGGEKHAEISTHDTRVCSGLSA